METCNTCEKEMEKPFWQNLLKAFCSLKCTNQYLESEGFETITAAGQSANLKPEFDKP